MTAPFANASLLSAASLLLLPGPLGLLLTFLTPPLLPPFLAVLINLIHAVSIYNQFSHKASAFLFYSFLIYANNPPSVICQKPLSLVLLRQSRNIFPLRHID